MVVGQNQVPYSFSSDDKELSQQCSMFASRGNEIWRNNYPGAGLTHHAWRPEYDPLHPYKVSNELKNYGVQTIYVAFNGNDNVPGWEKYYPVNPKNNHHTSPAWARIYRVAELINQKNWTLLKTLLPDLASLPEGTIIEAGNYDLVLAGCTKMKELYQWLDKTLKYNLVLPCGAFLYAEPTSEIRMQGTGTYVSEFGISKHLPKEWMRFLHGYMIGRGVEIAIHHCGADGTKYEHWRNGQTMELWENTFGENYVQFDGFLPTSKTSVYTDASFTISDDSYHGAI